MTEQAEPTAINSKSDADWLLLCFYSNPPPPVFKVASCVVGYAASEITLQITIVTMVTIVA